MVPENELLIKINADAKEALDKFDDIKSKTETLEDKLTDVAKVSAVAWAALTAEIGFAVHAFAEADAASKQLNLALQNQGIFTTQLAKDYKEYAEAVQTATGIDDDAITKAQAIAQGYLGQTKITEKLSFAIADLAQTMGGDLNAAATAIGKTIGTGTNAFARQGLVISDTASTAERFGKVLEFVNTKAGGLAAETGKGLGSIRGLQTAFGNFQEQIGQRFAPIIETVVRFLTSLFQTLQKHQAIADITVAVIAAGSVIAALGVAIPLVVTAFTTLTAAVAAFGIATNVAFIGIPLLIATIVGAITLMALNWEKSLAGMKAALNFTLTFFADALSGLGNLIIGAFTLDPKKIQEGLSQIKASYAAAKADFKITYAENTQTAAAEEEKQNKIKKDAADKRNAIEKQHQENLASIRRASSELFLLEAKGASEKLIEIKRQEIDTLKKLDEQRSAEEIAALRAKYAELVAEEENQRAQDAERRAAYDEELKAARYANYADETVARQEFTQRERQEIESQILTDQEAEKKVLADQTKRRIESRNQELIERKKYGAAIATIDAALHSQQIEAAKSVSGELVGLANSKNSTLKAIGKTAAIAQITIATAESAVNIAKAVFEVIPFPFSIPIAAALSAARIAYGAEQIANVNAAAEGGLVEGGIPGRDSVPFLLEPGELVVPRRNFNDVVGAVQGGTVGGREDEIVSALQSIDAKISTPQQTVIQGDVLADENYIDALVKKISDAIEFRNAKIFGVNI